MPRRLFALLCLLAAPLAAQAPAPSEAAIPPRQPIPPQILEEARQATQALASQIAQGQAEIVLQRMNPEWKAKEALKLGGLPALDQAFARALAEQRAAGTQVLAMEALPAQHGFEVDFSRPDSNRQASPAYQQWLVFVPTKKIIEAFDHHTTPPTRRRVLLQSFMVALRAKSGGPWTFIDGSSLRSVDLRQVFPFLPVDEKQLGFPPRGGEVLPDRAR